MRASALMLQGTSSHVGKTVLVAGLCRLLARRGLRVLPFKAQNMSLNAWVTPDGLEMGWAQAMQAEAAGVPPSVEMNPILLKPRSGGKSQVVVLGRALGDRGPRAYWALTPRLWPAVEHAWDHLAGRADVVVIEGAGSPAEPNLMRHDLANMRVARLTRAPVLLVGDIDRGGVFASLLGTLAILPPADRRRIQGVLINRFRGDARLLAGGLRDFRRRTGLPVVGVVPYLADLRLPEEDSVGLGQGQPRALRLAVVRLPHIANFTDVAPLGDEPGVEVAYASRPEDLGGAHVVVLPGSKDTIADLRWLKAQGLARAVRAHARSGGAVLGICGGYQMLGRLVSDPLGVESGGREAGLGLLPVGTRLGADKTTRRVTARWLPDGPEVPAYEIHMGITQPSGDRVRLRPLLLVDGRAEGWAHPRRRIWGTYLHGLFEAPASRRRLLSWARGARPRRLVPRDHRQVREAAYERLADALEGALDWRWLARLLRA